MTCVMHEPLSGKTVLRGEVICTCCLSVTLLNSFLWFSVPGSSCFTECAGKIFVEILIFITHTRVDRYCA